MDVLNRSRNQPLILGGIAIGALLMVGLAIITSANFVEAPNRIAFGVTLDVVVMATAIGWWFAVRRAELPTWIAVAALGWGVVVARLWVPQAPIALLVATGGVAEAVTIAWAAARLQRIVRTARAARDQGQGSGSAR